MMKLFLLFPVVCLSGASGAWASSFTPSTNPGDFAFQVGWCSIAGTNCTASDPTPTSWTETVSGLGGQAGLFYDTQPFDVSPDPHGMGVINSYYTSADTTVLDDVAATFNGPVLGAGAYIESVSAGDVFASVFLFNAVYNTLIGYTWEVNFTAPNQVIFIGANDSIAEVSGVIFDVADASNNIQPFQVGTLGFNTPEPGSMALMGTALLGLAGLLRKRVRKS